MTLRCSAILFDMDGTLVDSTAIVERAWERWAGRHGIPLETVLAFSHGRPTIATMEHFCPGMDNATEAAEMLLYEETEVNGVVPIPGATEAVAAAARGQWAVVTSATRRLAEIRISAAGLPLPKVLVGVEDTERGKPNPDPYLRAAKLLGVAPSECCVFEDTGPGIDAGVRAGMQAVGLVTTVRPDQLGTDCVVRDFRDIHITARNGGFDVLVMRSSAAANAPSIY